jgi:SAM-dependent methyltransferase
MRREELKALYRHRFAGEAERRRGLWEALCRGFFDRYVQPTDVLVDLGAGSCEFLNASRARRKVAVDPNPDTAAAADPGVEVVPCRARDLPASLDGAADVVFLSNFLEHLDSREEVLEVLAAARRCLRPGGLLLVLGPNIRYAYHVYWDFFDHKIALSDRSVVEALRMTAFDIVEIRPRFLPFTSKSRLPAWRWLVRLYLLLPPVQALVGGQMLVVGRRP